MVFVNIYFDRRRGLYSPSTAKSMSSSSEPIRIRISAFGMYLSIFEVLS